jgi:predicted nucleotide-binding protein
LQLQYEEFNRVPAAGIATEERLAEMLDQCGFAFLVLTGEDIHRDRSPRPFGFHLWRLFSSNTVHARENVIHEVGLFQGRLGWRRAIPLLEVGCETFSNILGLNHIPFDRGNIKSCFPQIRRVLVREGILDGSGFSPLADRNPA